MNQRTGFTREFREEVFSGLQKLLSSQEAYGDRLFKLYRFFNHIMITVTERDQIQFHTLFARLAWLNSMFRISKRLNRLLQQFRIDAEAHMRDDSQSRVDGKTVFFNGISSLLLLFEEVDGGEVPAELRDAVPPGFPVLKEVAPVQRFTRSMRCAAVGLDDSVKILHCISEETGEELKVHYAMNGRSEIFKENIDKAIEVIGFPFTLSIVDIEFYDDGVCAPRTLVVVPDYLIDVSAIAECFSGGGPDQRVYVMNSFLPRDFSIHILLGNAVNFLLDELVRNRSVELRKILLNLFAVNPTAFALLNDTQLRGFIDKLEFHFQNLKTVFEKYFPAAGIDPGRVSIEPAFYAPQYGIQGRLDLFYEHVSKGSIVELKSGKPFNPNVHGLGGNHYVQTLLYDLLVKAVYDHKISLSNYILYSGQSEKPLRFAPPVSSLQRESIRLRNDIVLAEYAMSGETAEGLISKINTANMPGTVGYMTRNLVRFSETISRLSELERGYLFAFNRLVSNEHALAKVGEHGDDSRNGLAGIWLDARAEKEEQFCILADLEIRDRDTATGEITLSRSTTTNTLANFRVGDIAVLYPSSEGARTKPEVLSNQVFKCTLTTVTPTEVSIRLRNKQVQYERLENGMKWNLEHDVLDSSFMNMRRALFEFAELKRAQRDRFLGITPPAKYPVTPVDIHQRYDDNIRAVISNAVSATDYYLVWGPPGTGKTSVVTYEILKHLITETDQSIMLMAYTNRAVDEICATVERLSGDLGCDFIRIGSRIATSPKYRSKLLSVRMESIKSRDELHALLYNCRIFVGTVSSVSGKKELFDLKQFETVIIDEASQILEPMLAGLLPKFPKWILIGDHKQLPAVVVQPEERTVVRDVPGADRIKLVNTRISYFERIFELSVANGWSHAIGRLRTQGRMHCDIMQFASEHFYDGQLDALRADQASQEPAWSVPESLTGTATWQRALLKERMIYIPSTESNELPWSKMHDNEAGIVVEVIKAIRSLNTGAGAMPSIGVITPFRAQIANILSKMDAAGLADSGISVDTVERYQGSARDVIIFSLTIGHPDQYRQITSYTADGTDRKLNVAITRGRKQFIWTGQPDVVMRDRTYARLREYCTEVSVPVAADDKVPVS